jgi:hypothetical protein
MHKKLAGWKSKNMCQAKQEEGLGIRNMHSMNKAYVMKLGWGIIHDNNNLWADVLRSKYVKTQDRIPQVQAKGKDSPLWKTICKVWPQVIEGLGWSVGNGVEVRFWKDNWLEGIGPLVQHALQDIPVENLNVSVANMESNIQWRWDFFAHLLPIQIIMVMASYPPSSTYHRGRFKLLV